MKKITLLLLGFLVMTSAKSDDDVYHPLVVNGRKWVYMFFQQVGSSHEITPLYLYSLEIKNDGIVYYTLLDKGMNPISESTPVALLFEWKTKRNAVYRLPYEIDQNTVETVYNRYPFWFYNEEGVDPNNIDITIYNFIVEGYLPPINYNYMYYTYYVDGFFLVRNIDEKTTVMVGGESHNAYILNTNPENSFDEFFYGCKVIEGIGIDSRSGDLLSPQLFPATGMLSQERLPGLVAVYDGNELIYKGCLYDEAMEFSAITTVDAAKQPQGVRYYNLAGIESAEPFKGVNLKVTTYTDGTRTTEKIIK